MTIGPGDVLDGTYVIERRLGEGGMGAVYVAREDRLGRRVAIKVLLDAVANDPAARARFEREGRSAAALQSDHVTRVLSVGQLPGGAPYIVMELLEGQDLAALLAARGPLPAGEVVGYIVQVCEALSEAHALGIVHRDLKPANVFLARRPTGATTVKVLDFGISKGATGSASPLTGTSSMMGTPLYMSPEQLRDARSVDGRTDIWSLGVMMYELLSGKPPFLAEGLAELCLLITAAQPRPLLERRADVPPALAAVVHSCIHADPAHRFATVGALMTALSTLPPGSMRPGPLARGMPTERISSRALPTMGLPGAAQQTGPQHGPHAQHAGPHHTNLQPLAPQTPPSFTRLLPHTNDPPRRPGSNPALSSGALHRSPSDPHAVNAATVDPVSTTQPWLPSPGHNKAVRLVGLGLVFAAAAAAGVVVFKTYVFSDSTSSDGNASASASGASSLAASDAAPSALGSTATTIAAEPSATTAAAAPSARPNNGAPLAAPPLPAPMESTVALPAAPLAAPPLPAPLAAPSSVPPPAAPVPNSPPTTTVVFAPPSAPPPLAPSARAAPTGAARPAPLTTSDPASIMPGARN